MDKAFVRSLTEAKELIALANKRFARRLLERTNVSGFGQMNGKTNS